MQGIGHRWRRILSSGLSGPAAVTLVSVGLLVRVSSTESLGVQADAYGPQSWPLFTLVLLVLGMALLCAFRVRDLLRGTTGPSSSPEPPPLPGASRVIGATALIALYGAGFVYAGFLFSTIAFLALWLVYMRYRRPLGVALISVLGAVLPLYLLIKVAYMPLPRGVGVLEEATVQLYHWLRLF